MSKFANFQFLFQQSPPPKIRASWLPLALIAAVSGGFLCPLQAGSISAYRDDNGRVVFVNEQSTEASLSSDQAIPASPLQDLTSESRGSRAVFQSAWDEMIQGAAKRHHMDPALVRALIQVESNFNPFAVSSRGAMGLMQLIPSTARRFGVKNIFDPKSNLDGGLRYLKYLMTLFRGDLRLSLAAYNAGENAVDRHSGVPPYPETQDYLRRISDLYPLSAGTRGVIPANVASTEIGKYVDSHGIVHFSNTDMP